MPTQALQGIAKYPPPFVPQKPQVLAEPLTMLVPFVRIERLGRQLKSG
jgi:hypothetical protein